MPLKLRPSLWFLLLAFSTCLVFTLASADGTVPATGEAPATVAKAGAIKQPENLIEYYFAGGVLMHPILLCSIVGAAVVFERMIRLRRDRIVNDEIVDRVREELLAGRREQALAAAQSDTRLCSFIMARALDDHIFTHATLEDALTEAGERHIDALSQRMSVLSVVIKISPMLGLLGTVQGIIGAFGNMTGGEVVKERMANDIMVALITTFAGLSVAIPGLIGESYVRGIIRSRIADLEEIFISLVKADHIAGLNRTAGAGLDAPVPLPNPAAQPQLAQK
ncbi:MAG TPA: MotA/TolQ/ExbB proton channel family protein [Planctomycetota bacterium]|nr:MotA/TolQ/ExbB proton channel family protein [Planctomycetota bacterium]